MSDLTRPIIGIENRTAQEVFDIMCDRFRAAERALAERAGGVKVTHRHKKRGTEYVLIGIGKMQAEDWRDQSHAPNRGGYHPSVDMREVAIYRSATDPTEIWVRPHEEFEDGRFEDLTTEPAARRALEAQGGENG